MSGKGLPEGITFRDCCPACGDEYDKWQADLARLREENATLKEALDKSEESRIGWMEGWHKKASESEAENARLSALVEEVREIVEDYYKYAGNNYQICGLNFTANDWLRRAGEWKQGVV